MKKNISLLILSRITQCNQFVNTIAMKNKPNEKEIFYNVPTSPATNGILKVLSSGKENLARMNERAKTVSHTQQVKVLQNEKKRQVTINSNNSTVTVEIADIDKLMGSNKTAKKLFIFNLIKINEKAYSGETLRRNYIQYGLQELQDIEFYNTLQSARKGFKNGMDMLTSLKLKGSMKKGKKEVIMALEVLFTGANIKNGVCTVYINERINWDFIAAFYTILPRFSFKLNNRAFDLMLYIFYLARQNIREIEEESCFNISLRAVQNQLQLPNELRNKDPQRTIKEPVEKAIAEIMQYKSDSEFTIELVADNNSPITAYLDNGYIKITLKGNYAKNFIALSRHKAKQIETARKKRETMIEKAIAINTAKNIERAKKAEGTSL